MTFDLLPLSNLPLIIAVLSIIVCPTLCGVMAYRISRNYSA
jgi:hypothetical protein